MLWCESVAPLGKPVVPLVYWMLIGSSKASVAIRSRSASSSTAVAASAAHSSVSRNTTDSSASSPPRTSSTIAV